MIVRFTLSRVKSFRLVPYHNAVFPQAKLVCGFEYAVGGSLNQVVGWAEPVDRLGDCRRGGGYGLRLDPAPGAAAVHDAF